MGNTYNWVYIWCCKYGENRYCERCANEKWCASKHTGLLNSCLGKLCLHPYLVVPLISARVTLISTRGSAHCQAILLRHFVIQAFCRFDWFVSIVALHTTWQSIGAIWCAAQVWTNLDRCAVIRLCRISWWAGTAPNLLWWLQMPWCETGTKLKRKCQYLDDKMNTFPFQGWSLAATVLISLYQSC